MWSMAWILAVACATSATAELPPEIPRRPGPFAFHYAARYTGEQVAWLSRFAIVVSGDFLPEEQVTALKADGTKLLYYEWLPAFYVPRPDSADATDREAAQLVEDHPEWLINPTEPLFGHAGSDRTGAYYYDMAVRELRQWRVAHIAEQARRHGYDGVFFDTTTHASVHPVALDSFKRFHPETNYDACVALMLAGLREAAPDLTIFTNQGYRNHPYYLPFAHLDLSESYMTSTAGAPEAEAYIEGQGLQKVKESFIAPWFGKGRPQWPASEYCKALITDAIGEFAYPVRFCHLNYGYPRYAPTGETAMVGGRSYPVMRPTPDREALYYGVACAKLMGHESYFEPSASLNSREAPADDVYFVDLGRPLGEDYSTDEPRGLAWRMYENGFVAVNDGGMGQHLRLTADAIPSGVTGLWDVFAGREVVRFVQTRRVWLPVSRYVATGRTEPAGRVFAYLRR